MGTAIVDGHEGAGKSTLIRCLLESNKSRSIQVSLCLARPGSGRRSAESSRHAHGKSPHERELNQWLDAGAIYANVLTYDPDQMDIETLIEEADEGSEDWDEWVLEGRNVPLSRVHCSVFVLRPLTDSTPLVQAKDYIVDHMPLEEYLQYSAGEAPGEPEECEDSSEEVVVDLPFDEELPDRLAAAGVELDAPEKERLRILLRDGVPIWSKRPELRAECARLPAAEVVVINTHDESEHARAEATRVQILKLFRDWDLRYKLGFRSNVTRPGIYIANLQDPGDAGTKAALAQIKRKLRGR